MPLTAALVGAGRIAREHVLGLLSCPVARLVGVCDRSAALARYTAGLAGGVATFTDHREMLSALEPRVVHVLTPAATHVAIASDCLRAGAHVIVEKPIAPTCAEFETLWALSGQCGRHLIEDHNYLFNEPVLTLQRLVADGVLGEVREVEVRLALAISQDGGALADPNVPHPSQRMPLGALHEFITHLAYLGLHFAAPNGAAGGPEFDSVHATVGRRGPCAMLICDDLDAVAMIGGVRVRLRFDAVTQPDGFSVTVRGSAGSATVELFNPAVQMDIARRGPAQLRSLINQHRNGRALKRAARRNFFRKLRNRTPYEGLHSFIRRTYAALAAGHELPVTYPEMRRTLRLIEAIAGAAGRP